MSNSKKIHVNTAAVSNGIASNLGIMKSINLKVPGPYNFISSSASGPQGCTIQ